MTNKIYLNTYDSPVGNINILSVDNGLLLIAFNMKEVKKVISQEFSDYEVSKDNKINKKMIKYLDAYFSSKKVSIEIPLFLNGTEFQKKVWLELKEIPYGETISYKELAKRVGIKKGYQAVGQANSKNPFPILLPCHRVINTDGKMGGYSGGLNKKKILLKLEGIEF